MSMQNLLGVGLLIALPFAAIVLRNCGGLFRSCSDACSNSRLPLSTGEVLGQLPLGNCNLPKPALSATSPDRNPKHVLAGSRLVFLGSSYQQPLPRELTNARIGQVVQIQWFKVSRRELLCVMNQQRRAANVQAGSPDGQQQRANVKEIGGLKVCLASE